MIYFSQQITQMKQIGKSLRSCLSASPSACTNSPSVYRGGARRAGAFQTKCGADTLRATLITPSRLRRTPSINRGRVGKLRALPLAPSGGDLKVLRCSPFCESLRSLRETKKISERQKSV